MSNGRRGKPATPEGEIDGPMKGTMNIGDTLFLFLLRDCRYGKLKANRKTINDGGRPKRLANDHDEAASSIK